MGLDAQIFFRVRNGAEFLPNPFGPDGRIVPVDPKYPESYPEGATHELATDFRYYSDGYERGNWRLLGGMLMYLHSREEVEKVWYGSDCGDDSQTPECPPERVLELSAHYMKHGHRPYEAKY